MTAGSETAAGMAASTHRDVRCLYVAGCECKAGSWVVLPQNPEPHFCDAGGGPAERHAAHHGAPGEPDAHPVQHVWQLTPPAGAQLHAPMHVALVVPSRQDRSCPALPVCICGISRKLDRHGTRQMRSMEPASHLHCLAQPKRAAGHYNGSIADLAACWGCRCTRSSRWPMSSSLTRLHARC